MTQRAEAIEMIRGLVLTEAAAIANGDAVRTELKDEFDTEQLKVLAFIGERSTLIVLSGITWDKVMSHPTVREALTRQIRERLTELQRSVYEGTLEGWPPCQ